MMLQRLLSALPSVRTAWLAPAVTLLALLVAATVQRPGDTTGNACTGTAACAAHDERTGTGNRRHERILHWIRMPFFSFARPLRGGRRP